MSTWSRLSPRIAQLAADQWGHVTREQLLALGVTADDIRYRVGNGTLIVVHRGVYALGYRRVEPVARAMAAVLAGGPGAVLSHDSALALWDLGRWPRRHELTVAGQVRRPGIVAHRSTTLTARQRTTQLGVPVTRAARAIDDTRARRTQIQQVRLVNDARLRRVVGTEEARRLLGHGRNPTRSGLEDAFQRWLQRHGVPQPVINALVAGHEVDAVWWPAKVIAELDDPETHWAMFAADRRRDREHADLGFLTIRCTRADLTAEEAARLMRILAERGPR